MKFLTPDEARSWCERFTPHHERGSPSVVPDLSATFGFEHKPAYTYYFLSKSLVSMLGAFDWALLWVTGWGVWASNENLHLYYRVRESYGNANHLHDQPAIVSLRHEERDLTTFVHLGMLFGWDMTLVANQDRCRIHVSHDGYVQVMPSEGSEMEEIQSELEELGLQRH